MIQSLRNWGLNKYSHSSGGGGSKIIGADWFGLG